MAIDTNMVTNMLVAVLREGLKEDKVGSFTDKDQTPRCSGCWARCRRRMLPRVLDRRLPPMPIMSRLVCQRALRGFMRPLVAKLGRKLACHHRRDKSWKELITNCSRIRRFAKTIEGTASNAEAFWWRLGIAHVAYHLGSIRQKVAQMRG